VLLDFEEYEAAAWGIADQVLPDSADVDALLGCTATPLPALEKHLTDLESRLRTFAVRLLAEGL
jgi:hypothetical protein